MTRNLGLDPSYLNFVGLLNPTICRADFAEKAINSTMIKWPNLNLCKYIANRKSLNFFENLVLHNFLTWNVSKVEETGLATCLLNAIGKTSIADV